MKTGPIEDTLNIDPTEGVEDVERNDPIEGTVRTDSIQNTVGNDPAKDTVVKNSTEDMVRADPTEDILRTDADSSSKEKVTDADLKEGSDTSSEGGSGSSAGDSDTICGYNVADGSPVHNSDHSHPPPIPEDLPFLTLNANANNNNIEWTEAADFLPPPTEFLPPPSELTDQEGDEEGVVLLSMVTHREDVPVIPIGVEDAIKRPENVREKLNEGEKKEEDLPDERKESIGSKLNELDTMVTSLQKLITETTGTPPPSSPPPPPPPHPPPPSHSNPASPKKNSSLPPKPKPPPVKWRPPKKQPDPDTAKEELFAKLKERQQKLQAHAEAESTAPPPTVDPHSQLSTTQPPGNMVQLQLQYLQQQVLQQQMMQLQWQQLALQQNTGMMLPTINQAFLQPAAPLFGVQHQPVAIPQSMIQPTAMVGSTAQPMPVAGFVPTRAHPQAVVQQPTSSLSQLQFPQGIVQSAIPCAYSIPPEYTVMNLPANLPPTASAANPPPSTSSPPSISTPPPPPPTSSPPPLISSSEGMSPIKSGQNSGEQTPHASDCHKPSHQDLRSMALGDVEDRFDSLMVEVRDTDPNEILKKVVTYCRA